MSESENVSSLLQDAGLGRELRAALEAGRAHDPTPGELAGLTKKLAALLPPGTLPPAPAPAPPSPPAGPEAPPAAGLSGAAKIAGAIAVLGAIGGAVWLARAPAVVVAPVPGASVVVVADPPPAPSSVASSAPSVPEPIVSASAAPVASVVVAPRPSSTSTASAIAEPAEPEAIMIKRAHDALLQGSADRALALVGDHAQAYPKGALAQEREVIAIEALVALGRNSDARARAATFRAAYPASVHLTRIERLVGAP